MQVLHIISNKDNSGGTIAALNLHGALQQKGINSAVLSSAELEGFLEGNGYRRFGGIVGRIQQGLLKLENLFAKPGWINPIDKFVSPNILDNYSGIVHIHVTHVAQISFDLISKLAKGNKVFWTLHDLWPLTAKCIHPIDCDRYISNCHHCPKLQEYPKLNWDNTPYLHQQKRNFIKQHKIHFVSPSKWIKSENEAYINTLDGRISTIPHAVNSNFSKALIGKENIRKEYNIPVDGDVILFPQGRWEDEKKGASWFEAIKTRLAECYNSERKIYLTKLTGDVVRFNKLNSWLTEMHLPATSDKEIMAAYYQLSDCSISLSEIETFGLCVAESLACGVPVLARSAKGVNELLVNDVIAYTKDELADYILEQKWQKFNYEPLFSRVGNDMNINNWAKAHIALYAS
ncbi:glycosyltransferase [Pedobacter sp. Leaf170]|uniref:glycosyltransferase n=1 Tax=Pedobacter sp. Leaf170 TaxID=2876558 RepID=UPI001E36406D|nr:glycosyltransferase [Pedobacter sp. Leaf170]